MIYELKLIFISPFMSYIGFSLGMNISHFEAFPLSVGKSRFQANNLHIFGLVRKVLTCRWFLFHFDHGLGLRESPKMYNSSHDWAPLIRNFVLIIILQKF
jgi:hypothetical protein